MKYKLTVLMREIRIALDQNMSSAALSGLGDVDTLSLDEVIKSKIEEAARMVILGAPIHLLGTGVPFANSIAWNGEAGHGSGYILLPKDFLRLVTFQMSDWSRPVFDTITPDSPLYSRLHSRYAGIGGNPQKPVVVLVNTSVGQTLEFYSCSGGSGVSIKQASYIPMPKIMGDGIYLEEKLKEPVVYYAAYLVALTTGQQAEQAAVLLNISNSLLEK